MNSFDDLGEACRRGVSLGPLTWFKLGGPAEYLIDPASEAQLAAIVRHCRQHNIPMRVLGLGANLLVNDDGVSGVVLRFESAAFTQTVFSGATVTAGAGVSLAKLVLATVKRGLAGIEHLAGIPASIGGAIRMNCGGKYGDISTAVRSVRVVSPAGEIYDRDRDELEFGYRHCRLGGDFVVAATFALCPTDPEELHTRFREIWMYKQNTQPTLSEQSAGCIFRNPDGHSAGRLIDQAGLKGCRVGGAFVSDRHANFIIADPGTTAADIRELISVIQRRVEAAHGISLQPEVQIW
jgi:UDP-N-acetylmuramate dehydrogenase